MMPLLYSIAVIIDSFNSPLLAMGLVSAGTGLVFLTSRGHAVALLASTLFAWLLSGMLKFLFAVPRPDLTLVEVTGYRFPSQHAVVASAFVSSLCFTLFCVLPSPYAKIVVCLFSLAVIIIVAWSRVFLHAHLPIDVIAGSILGMSVSLIIHFSVLKKCYV